MATTRHKQYVAFVAQPESLPLEQSICLFIKDLTPGPGKYDTRFVKAVVSASAERLAESDTLLLRSLGGRAYPHTLAIKVLKELGEYVTGSPYERHVGFSPAKESA